MVYYHFISALIWNIQSGISKKNHPEGGGSMALRNFGILPHHSTVS